ncbi:MAG: CHASE3 domain-containing protein, partial [Gemmatimonadales bacterium]
MKRPVTNFGFGAAFCLLAWVGWRANRSSVEARASARWVTHTHEVLERLGTLLSSFQDAETGQRGYIITGKDEYLEPYTAAGARVGGQLGDL